MRFFVTGGSGMIGSKFVTELSGGGHEVAYTFNTRNPELGAGLPIRADITDGDLLESKISEFGPDVVVHCAALTKVDLCETDPKLAMEINVRGTENVAAACKISDSKIVYVSTSFVFDGTKDEYREDDKTHAINHYGSTKLEGEKVTENSGQPYLILRTDHPYRWSPFHVEKNNIMRMIGLFERGESFREATDWFNTPTLVDDIVEVGTRLISNWEDGVFHVTGPDYVSRYDLAMKVAEAVGGNKDLVKKIKTADLKLPTERPNVRMVSSKAEKKTGFKTSGLEDGIAAVLEQRGLNK